MRRAIYILLIFTILLSGCKKREKTEEFVRPIKIAYVMHELPDIEEKLSGTVRAVTESYPVFRVPGSVNQIYVKPGQYVTRGELIATLDPREYEVVYAAAESKYLQTEGEVNRVIELYNRNSVSKNDYDKAISGLQSVKSIYESALYNLEDTKLYSPITGYIQQIKVGLNQTVTPMTQVVSIVNTESLCIETNISSSLYLKRNQFEGFTATSPIISGTFPLTLSYIAPKANNSQLYRMQLLMDKEKSQRLAPGMVVEIQLRYKEIPDEELTVPLSALFSQEGKSYVWVLDTTEYIVNKQEVEIANINRNGHSIILSGLKGNEAIVVAGVNMLHEGQKVKLEKQATLGNSANIL